MNNKETTLTSIQMLLIKDSIEILGIDINQLCYANISHQLSKRYIRKNVISNMEFFTYACPASKCKECIFKWKNVITYDNLPRCFHRIDQINNIYGISIKERITKYIELLKSFYNDKDKLKSFKKELKLYIDMVKDK